MQLINTISSNIPVQYKEFLSKRSFGIPNYQIGLAATSALLALVSGSRLLMSATLFQLAGAFYRFDSSKKDVSVDSITTTPDVSSEETSLSGRSTPVIPEVDAPTEEETFARNVLEQESINTYESLVRATIEQEESDAYTQLFHQQTVLPSQQAKPLLKGETSRREALVREEDLALQELKTVLWVETYQRNREEQLKNIEELEGFFSRKDALQVALRITVKALGPPSQNAKEILKATYQRKAFSN